VIGWDENWFIYRKADKIVDWCFILLSLWNDWIWWLIDLLCLGSAFCPVCGMNAVWIDISRTKNLE
jgi:hypothetical protein